MNVHDQEKIDSVLIKLDGTKQKKDKAYLFQFQQKNFRPLKIFCL